MPPKNKAIAKSPARRSKPATQVHAKIARTPAASTPGKAIPKKAVRETGAVVEPIRVATLRTRPDVAGVSGRAKPKTTLDAGKATRSDRVSKSAQTAAAKAAAKKTAKPIGAETAANRSSSTKLRDAKTTAGKATAKTAPVGVRRSATPARDEPARAAAQKASAARRGATPPAPNKTSNPDTATKTAVASKRKATMPTKKNAADAAQTATTKTVKAGPTPGKTATTRHAAAAFVAARKKMSPAAKPEPASSNPASSNNVDALKGVVEVADKSVKKAADDKGTVPPVPETEAARPAVVAPRVGAPAPVAPKPKPAATKGLSFKTNEFIVYPAHGVGEIVAVEEQEVAGYKLELFVISFIKDKMILKVPLPKAASVGMRKLADTAVMKRALDTLTGRARIKRTMWSRRAQEYEAKINSGDLVAIAEVVRDLYRSDAQPEQSYSERQLYEAALDRMAREIAVVQKLTDTEALKLIDMQLQKGPRRAKTDDAETDEGGDSDDDGIVEAA